MIDENLSDGWNLDDTSGRAFESEPYIA